MATALSITVIYLYVDEKELILLLDISWPRKIMGVIVGFCERAHKDDATNSMLKYYIVAWRAKRVEETLP